MIIGGERRRGAYNGDAYNLLQNAMR